MPVTYTSVSSNLKKNHTMYILGKYVDKIEQAEIERLVQNQVSENKSLDYKRELNIDSDKDKKEFLFDITSLYNSEGGCLIYGIEEAKDQNGQNTGIPEKIVGLPANNMDKLFQKIEDVVRSNTEPSINSLALKTIDINGDLILIIGVSKGLGLPAMVTFKQTNKFYRRRNTGKYSVDVYELNQMFMQHQVLKERAEHFRQDRIDKVISQKVFPNLNTIGSFFIHIVPFTFLSDNLIDFTKADSMNLSTVMKPMYTTGWDHMHNLDGYATFSTSHNRQEIDGYDQVMRAGLITGRQSTTEKWEDVLVIADNNIAFVGGQ